MYQDELTVDMCLVGDSDTVDVMCVHSSMGNIVRERGERPCLRTCSRRSLEDKAYQGPTETEVGRDTHVHNTSTHLWRSLHVYAQKNNRSLVTREWSHQSVLFIQCLQYYTLTTECLFRSTIYKSSE